MTYSYLEISHVQKSYRVGAVQTPVLHDLSLGIPRGSFNAIVGPSGCGKSTLLALIGALDRPDSGSIAIEGIDVARADRSALSEYRRKHVGFVFQSYNLLRSLTALENVEAALQFSSMSASERRARATESLESVGLLGVGAKLPHQLSGGQQQRVAIARAIARRPSLLLADEPTGNLDREAGALVFRTLCDLQRSLGITCLIVTHDPDLAASTDDVIRMLNGRVTA